MSFDTEFDYTPIITYLNNRIAELDQDKSVCNNEVNMMTSVIPRFNLVIQEQLEYNKIKIQCLENTINKIKALLTAIDAVVQLPTDTKQLFYDFYLVYGKYDPEPFNYKVHWMRQMIYNHQDMIPYITDLLNDKNMTDDHKKCVGDNVCYMFDARQETASFHHVLLTHSAAARNNS